MFGNKETVTIHGEKEKGGAGAVGSREDRFVTVTGKNLDEAHLKAVINGLGYQA